MSEQLSIKKKLRVVSLYESGYGVSTISQQLSISASHTARIVNRYLRYGNSGLERLPTVQFSVSFKQEVVSSVLQKCLSFRTSSPAISDKPICGLMVKKRPKIAIID